MKDFTKQLKIDPEVEKVMTKRLIDIVGNAGHIISLLVRNN